MPLCSNCASGQDVPLRQRDPDPVSSRTERETSPDPDSVPRCTQCGAELSADDLLRFDTD